MPVTQADIDNLNKALSQGEKIVRIGDKWVEYHTPNEIIKARNDLQKQLEAANGIARSRVVYHTQRSRGY